jgi:hypothetical protein
MNPYNSHTHCQVAPANPQAKTCQRVCLFQRTTDRQSGRKMNTEAITSPIRNGGLPAVLLRGVHLLKFSAKTPMVVIHKHQSV